MAHSIQDRIIVQKYKSIFFITKYERKICRFLKEMNVYFHQQHDFKYKDSFIMVDILIPQVKVVIEVDGRHHYRGQNLLNDIERDRFLTGMGFRVIRIMNEQIKDMQIEDFKKFVTCPCCGFLK